MGDTPQQLQQQLDGKITVFDVSYFDQVLVGQGRDVGTLQAGAAKMSVTPSSIIVRQSRDRIAADLAEHFSNRVVYQRVQRIRRNQVSLERCRFRHAGSWCSGVRAPHRLESGTCDLHHYPYVADPLTTQDAK